jgi:hypothetical protein
VSMSTCLVVKELAWLVCQGFVALELGSNHSCSQDVISIIFQFYFLSLMVNTATISGKISEISKLLATKGSKRAANIELWSSNLGINDLLFSVFCFSGDGLQDKSNFLELQFCFGEQAGRTNDTKHLIKKVRLCYSLKTLGRCNTRLIQVNADDLFKIKVFKMDYLRKFALIPNDWMENDCFTFELTISVHSIEYFDPFSKTLTGSRFVRYYYDDVDVLKLDAGIVSANKQKTSFEYGLSGKELELVKEMKPHSSKLGFESQLINGLWIIRIKPAGKDRKMGNWMSVELQQGFVPSFMEWSPSKHCGFQTRFWIECRVRNDLNEERVVKRWSPTKCTVFNGEVQAARNQFFVERKKVFWLEEGAQTITKLWFQGEIEVENYKDIVAEHFKHLDKIISQTNDTANKQYLFQTQNMLQSFYKS